MVLWRLATKTFGLARAAAHRPSLLLSAALKSARLQATRSRFAFGAGHNLANLFCIYCVYSAVPCFAHSADVNLVKGTLRAGVTGERRVPVPCSKSLF